MKYEIELFSFMAFNISKDIVNYLEKEGFSAKVVDIKEIITYSIFIISYAYLINKKKYISPNLQDNILNKFINEISDIAVEDDELNKFNEQVSTLIRKRHNEYWDCISDIIEMPSFAIIEINNVFLKYLFCKRINEEMLVEISKKIYVIANRYFEGCLKSQY
jgi:hypothetical protein